MRLKGHIFNQKYRMLRASAFHQYAELLKTQYMSFEEWERHWENRELEGNATTYTTPKGEKIHIYCQYGYDG